MSEEIKKVTKELPEERPKSEIEGLKEKVAEKERVIEQEKNKYLRLLADFDNFKKRMALEQENLIQFANENLILALLPVLDGFERAVTTCKDKKIQEEFVKGILLIKRQMEDALKKFGVESIPSLDKPYDANLHEAIMQKKSKKPEGIIIEEVQKGFTIHGKVIKPSMVIVSKKGK
jgi:molecular chaperone GrpE